MHSLHRDTAAIAFLDASQLVAKATLSTVALKVKRAYECNPQAQLLVFDAVSSHVIDLDLRGSDSEIVERLPAATNGKPEAGIAKDDSTENVENSIRGRGRPKLGVVPREITLLPRHWDWLNQQPGGASVALRKLVEEAKRGSESKQHARAAMESAYRFMAGIAGDQNNYEEASRALFAGDKVGFLKQLATWPDDVRQHLEQLAENAFSITQ
jgi:hypothetical protein